MISLSTFLILMVLDQAPIERGNQVRTIGTGDQKRTYILHVPPQFEPKKKIPLVIAFHGGGGNATKLSKGIGLSKKADEAGFLVAYPNGTGWFEEAYTFNAGNCCGYARDLNIDDVAFTRMMLDDISKEASIDKKRVFATGVSNGGMMAYRLASELSDRIAAIAPVSGTMGTRNCHPKCPVSVMHIHGTEDEYIPFNGGMGKGFSGTDFYSVDHSIQAWVKANRCDKEPKVEKIPDTAKDGTSITLKTYGSGMEGTEVVLVAVEGGGHTWPGLRTRLPELGKSTSNISANDVIWDFFVKHPKK